MQTREKLAAAKAIELAQRQRAEAEAQRSDSNSKHNNLVMLGKAVAQFASSAEQQVKTAYIGMRRGYLYLLPNKAL